MKEVSGKLCKHSFVELYGEFSRDVTVTMLMSPNKGTAAMLVSQPGVPTNPSGIELYSHANTFFLLFCIGNHMISSAIWNK